MTELVVGFGTLATAILAVPVLVLFVEICAGVLSGHATALYSHRHRHRHRHRRRGRVAVIVPAHDESRNVVPTIQDIKGQLSPTDRLIIVADNCSDDTAAVAADAGAAVVERNEPDKIGKGYALDFGLCHLRDDPPEVVVFVDADCRVHEGTIDELAAACEETGRPVQALDLMLAPEGAPINHQVAEFAWRTKNLIRPTGLGALGLPCQLMGTGMAFPWPLINAANVATAGIVEDLKLGLDLALNGKSAIFCPAAKVTSHFPHSAEASARQRERWERGHIGLILTTAPSLLAASVRRRDVALLALSLDLTVPPLFLLGALVAVLFGMACAAVYYDTAMLFFVLSAADLTLYAGSVLLAWWAHGRDLLPISSAPLVAGYVCRKCLFYWHLVRKRTRPQWTRTDRVDARKE